MEQNQTTTGAKSEQQQSESKEGASLAIFTMYSHFASIFGDMKRYNKIAEHLKAIRLLEINALID